MFLNIIKLKSNNCYRHTCLKQQTVNIELDIALTDDEPIFHKPRRLPFAERDTVDAQVNKWVENGIVEPCSFPYASQVVTNAFWAKYLSFHLYAVRKCHFPKSIVLPYMDDVIPAANESEGLEYLKNVLEVACDYRLEINFFKCQFLHNTIEFLGHIIENGRLFPSPSKTKAGINYPDLKNIKDIRQFLGLTGYFRKFLPSYSTIARPLSELFRTSFKIITDCDALVKMLSKKELNPRLARWALCLQEFNCTIVHRTGSKMAHVDALSRPSHCMLIQNSVHIQFLKAQQADHQITAIKTLLETTPHDSHIVKNKLLYKTVNVTDLLVVPDEMQANIQKST
ncbi:retrovirus-related Pol polyprotein from transposon 297 [Trichonephila clavipes]|uniref:Retrovirus-related Pol polyprotein from transposon 297 n=1 Tax=Trichonephila clavipes TaxID=2585209 RepID=A0A8X6SVE3_TRICX|nr:retrovirus-related Pol polyprotein from transposon 297 [Trichonephila clavipes]